MKEELKELLEKYWNADTSREEEELLRSAIAVDSDDPALQSYFLLQQVYNEQKAPEDLQSRIEAATIHSTSTTKIRSLRQTVFLAAASVGIIAIVASAILLYINQTNTAAMYADTFDTPEEAWQAMRTAFISVSENLDKGSDLLESEFLVLGNLEISEQ